MNSGKISIRYARAFLMSTTEKGCSEKVYKEMSLLASAFETYPELKTALASPTIQNAGKLDLLESVFAGKESKETKQFIEFVMEEKRIDYIDAIARSFEKLYREENKIVISNITSAAELSKESIEAIKKYITKVSGSNNVEVRTSVDESIIGGFILDIEGSRMDASVKGQLNTIKYYAGH